MMVIVAVILIVIGGILGGILVYYSKDTDVDLDKKISDKLREVPKMFEHARGTIKLATDGDKRFFNDPRVRDGINKAVSNGVKVKFLCEGVPPKWCKMQKGIEIKRVEGLPYHTMIIDDCHVRLEHPHKRGEFGLKKGDIALIFKNFPVLGKKQSDKFDALWTKSY